MKRALVDKLIASIKEEIERATKAARDAAEGATHVDNKPEGDKDMRSTEASYIARGQAELSFELPRAPRILFPTHGASVPSSDLTVAWSSEGEVEAFELQIEQADDDGLRVKLPPRQSTFQVPPGVLEPGAETALEIAAIGPNGNRTLTEVRFRTQH